MDYRKFGECYYIRMDRDDEIISTILEICKKENIRSATFSGIGGCKDAEIQTFIPETGSFEEQRISGMLELVSDIFFFTYFEDCTDDLIITIHSYVIAFAEFSVVHFLSPFKLLLLNKYCLTEILYSCSLQITIPKNLWQGLL